MKIQNLAIIFIIIIFPISLVLTSYTKSRVETIGIQSQYDSKLNDATHDALKAYQINSFNNDTENLTNSKIRDIEASVNTFFNSMATNFSSLGYTKDTMQNYVPAIVYTMYDGYYIYSPFTNTFDDETQEYVNKQKEANKGDSTHEVPFDGGQKLYGLKPYVYYSCRYKKGTIDVVITYSLDNYIQIQGTIDGTHTVSKYGYILNKADSPASTRGVFYDETSDRVWYNGIEITPETELRENVYVNGSLKNLPYIKKNGVKYYVDEDNDGDGKGDVLGKKDDNVFHTLNGTPLAQAPITAKEIMAAHNIEDTVLVPAHTIENNVLVPESTYNNLPALKVNRKTYYIDINGKVLGKSNDYIFSIEEASDGTKIFKEETTVSANEIKNNNCSAKEYYKEAYRLIDFIKTEGLNTITSNEIQPIDSEEERYYNSGVIFDFNSDIEAEESNFNAHRINVIKHSIERNLSIAISNFNNYTDVTTDFQMPKLKETDWDKITDNISIISFFQGVNIGGKVYNGYSIVTNTKNEDVVMEDSIYIKDGIMIKNFTDKNISTSGAVGVFNINTEVRATADGAKYYIPINESMLSYDSIITKNELSDKFNGEKLKVYIDNLDSTTYNKLKELYYTALARERYGLYRPKLEIN